MELPWNNPILYPFLLLAFIISFGAQWTNYRSQVKELTETIEDLDIAIFVSVTIAERRMKKRRNIIVYNILILLGLLIFLYFLP